ncbi:MAG: response regulator [Anaerolineales bacterium]
MDSPMGDNGQAAQPKKKIVIVEDDEDFLALVDMILADAGVEIIPALEGTQGLKAIRAHKPDLVILDLLLPDMNGWEVFLRMRSEAASERTPVIILTSQGTRTDRTFSLQVARVHDYLMKPCLPSQLRQSVASALQRSSESLESTA